MTRAKTRTIRRRGKTIMKAVDVVCTSLDRDRPSDVQVLFQAYRGRPCPVAPRDRDGDPVKPDGAYVFSLQQAATHFGIAEPMLRQLYGDSMAGVLADEDAAELVIAKPPRRADESAARVDGSSVSPFSVHAMRMLRLAARLHREVTAINVLISDVEGEEEASGLTADTHQHIRDVESVVLRLVSVFEGRWDVYTVDAYIKAWGEGVDEDSAEPVRPAIVAT